MSNLQPLPRVSILIPAYRCKNYIAQSLLSILHQERVRLQIIVVDDGSDDDQWSVICRLSRLANGHEFIPLRIQHQGYASAFNLALSKATCPYIARQDADDWSDTDRIIKEVTMLEKMQADICTCDMIIEYTDTRGGAVIHTGHMQPLRYIRPGNTFGPPAATVVARREVYEEVGGFSKEYEYSADGDWYFRALTCPYVWAHVPEALYHYRQHQGQLHRNKMALIQHEQSRRLHSAAILRCWNGDNRTGENKTGVGELD